MSTNKKYFFVPALLSSLLLGCDGSDSSEESKICKTYASQYIGSEGITTACEWHGGEVNEYRCINEEGSRITHYDNQSDFIKEFSKVGLFTRSATIYTDNDNVFFSQQRYFYNSDGALESIISTSSEDLDDLNAGYLKWMFSEFDEHDRPIAGDIETDSKTECLDWMFSQVYDEQERSVNVYFTGEGECFLEYQRIKFDGDGNIIEQGNGEQSETMVILSNEQLCELDN